VLYTGYWVGIGLLSYFYTLLSTPNPYSTICTMLAYPLLLLTYSRVFYGTSMVYIQQRSFVQPLTLSQTSSSGIGIGMSMSWSSIESRDAVMTWIVGEVHTLRQLPPPLLLPTTTNSSSNTSNNHNRQSASEDVNSYDHASRSDRVLVNLEKTIVSNRGNTSSNHSNSNSSSGGEKSDIAVLGEIELIPKQQQQQIMMS